MDLIYNEKKREHILPMSFSKGNDLDLLDKMTE